MGLPWLQVSTDVFSKAGPLAALLRIDEDKALAMLLRLWHYVVESAPEDGPPSGLIELADGPIIIAGAARWTGDPDELVRALRIAGFIEVRADALRVRGVSRYKTIWNKNRGPGSGRKQTGSRTEPGENPGGNRPDSEREPNGFRPQDGEEDRDQDGDLSSGEEVGATPSVGEASTLPVSRGEPWKPEAPPEPCSSWNGESWWRWFQWKRHQAGHVPEKPPHFRGLSSWASRALALTGSPERMKEAAYSFAEDAYWQQRGLPWAAFAKNFEKYVPRASREVPRVRS